MASSSYLLVAASAHVGEPEGAEQEGHARVEDAVEQNAADGEAER